MKFSTYKLGPNITGGWYWQVTKEGPQDSSIVIVVARSGISYQTEEGAIAGYKEFVKWASAPPSTGTPPSED